LAWSFGRLQAPARFKRAKAHALTGINGQHRGKLTRELAMQRGALWLNAIRRHRSSFSSGARPILEHLLHLNDMFLIMVDQPADDVAGRGWVGVRARRIDHWRGAGERLFINGGQLLARVLMR